MSVDFLFTCLFHFSVSLHSVHSILSVYSNAFHPPLFLFFFDVVLCYQLLFNVEIIAFCHVIFLFTGNVFNLVLIYTAPTIWLVE